MKLLAVVSTYYPDITEFENNIRSYIDDIDHLIIWENTPSEKSIVKEAVSKFNSHKIEIRTTGQNEFLAYPFNECIRWGLENKFTHLLTMDQDSSFIVGEFKLYKEQVLNENLSCIGIFCPATAYTINSSDTVQIIRFTYTSGSIHPINIFKDIGYFREDFLMYCIDTEFSFRVRKHGYNIVRYNNIKLNHKMGYAQKNKIGLTINNYPAFSTYLILRNTLVLWREHPLEFNKKERIYFIKYKIIYRLLKLIFEKDIFAKSKAIILGTIHGIKHKTGYYEIR